MNRNVTNILLFFQSLYSESPFIGIEELAHKALKAVETNFEDGSTDQPVKDPPQKN